MSNIVDIGQSPWEALSNFTQYPFIFRGVKCESMEGLLQSTKFSDPEKQMAVVKLYGIKAKRKGQKKKWWLTKTLFWLGSPMNRHGNEYKTFICEAYHELYRQNRPFRRALEKTGELKLTHSVGKSDPDFTILTESELTNTLTILRNYK